MGRLARVKSRTGIYHVMLRGINKQCIFYDNSDRKKFIEKIKIAKETADFKLYGYCLMPNHVHLLMGESEDIGDSMKRMTVGYVQWFNAKYERVGHLFQNRFLSEPVEDNSYLLTVLRYIHMNPVKAKMTAKPSDYPWSSYNLYISSYQNVKSYIDTELITSMFTNRNTFEDFMTEQNTDECLEYEQTLKITDSQLDTLIKKESLNKKLVELPLNECNRIIKEIIEHTGASIRQLERVSGINRGVIQRALKKAGD